MAYSVNQSQEFHEEIDLFDNTRPERGMKIAPENGVMPRLRASRRLSVATIEAFQIEPYKYANQWGWKYPIPAGGERWKNAKSDGAPKYALIPGKPEGAMFYHAPDLLQAIQEAGGVVWYTTEADVWALREAGIKNSFSTFSESIVPDNLGDTLLSMGVNHLLIAPDLDPAGEAWAERVKGALWGSTIGLTCYRLPTELGNGGDLGKAWQIYREPEPFAFWLGKLPQVEVTEHTTTHTTPAPVYFSDDPLAQIKQEVASLLGVDEFGPDNFSVENISCPVKVHHKIMTFIQAQVFTRIRDYIARSAGGIHGKNSLLNLA